ncbi:hypothetical protein TSUD_19340 [Trifolium subterraneum]|uniref:Uncharacterized protein n=1 Tax=Trifolium subterraneum TaxID=3900 RepID=A0A2Z6NI68_TRISU|nr:hypothetical protein TSUD_19340 [Trifolium subterraneum]
MMINWFKKKVWSLFQKQSFVKLAEIEDCLDSVQWRKCDNSLMTGWICLNHSLPSSLLILSRAFYISGKVKPEEVVQATLSAMPDDVVDTVGVTALPSGDSVSDKRKLEYLEMQEELFKEEEKEEQEQAKVTESIGGERNLAKKDMASTTEQTQEVKAKALEKHEQLCEISQAFSCFSISIFGEQRT